MSTTGQDVEKVPGSMFSIGGWIRRTRSLLIWPFSLWQRINGQSTTKASTVTHWDWRRKIMSTLIWLLSLFGWAKNEHKKDEICIGNRDMTCEELQSQTNSRKQEVTTPEWDDFSMFIKENENLRRQLYENEQQVDTLKKDCSQLRTRLSQIAAMQLTEGNPNIADLSDQNRPDKLAEQFSELFDNQWTDCFQILVDVCKMTEEESINILLKIVQTSYNICLDRSQNILTTTINSLFAFAGRSDEEPDKSLDTLIQEILHKLKSYRTKSFKAAPANIGKKIRARLKSTIGEPQVDVCSCFIEECIRTCWLMCIKDPPMFIFCDKEAVFDKNKYMEYTEMGQEVSYVVWPVLYLHKDGPLMRKGVAQGAGKKDRKRDTNEKATSHELPEKDHIQDNHTHIEEIKKQDHAMEASQTKENKSKDIANTDVTLLLSNMKLFSNGDEGKDGTLGKQTKSEDEAIHKQYFDDVCRGQLKIAETTPIIDNQYVIDSSEPSTTERRGNDNIFEPPEEVAEYMNEMETFDRDEIEARKINIRTKHDIEINESCPQNHTNLAQMEESYAISNIRTNEKDDQLEDEHSKAVNGDSDLPIVTEALTCEDNQTSTTLLSKVPEVEDNMVSSLMKQNAEIQMQQTASIINHSETKQPPLEPKVNIANREDKNEDCLKEDEKILDTVESRHSREEENVEVEKHSGSVRSENGPKSEGGSSCLQEPSGKNIPDCTDDAALVERLNENCLHSLRDDSSSIGKEENDETSTKLEVTELKQQADLSLIQSHKFCQQKKTSSCNGINEENNQGDEANDGSVALNDGYVGLGACKSFNGTSEKKSWNCISEYEQGDKLQSNNVFSSSDNVLTQNQEEDGCQVSPNNAPTEREHEADNTLSSSKEYCQHVKTSSGISINEQTHQRVEKHNESITCDSRQRSSSVPSAKNISDSHSDDEQKERLKLTSSSDDSINEETKVEDVQFPTKNGAMDGKEQTENQIITSQGYCKEMEPLRACKGNKEEDRGEEKQHGLIVFNTGQEMKEVMNVVHAHLEKNTYDPPQDADQGERL